MQTIGNFSRSSKESLIEGDDIEWKCFEREKFTWSEASRRIIGTDHAN